MQTNRKKTIKYFLAAAILFLAASPAAYGAAGADWWGPFDPPIRGGVVWKGVVSSVFEVVDISSVPDRLTPSSTGPADPDFYNDLIVKTTFTVTLQNTVRGSTTVLTFSGIARYTDPDGDVFNHFWLVADGQLITAAFVEFLRGKFSDPADPLYGGAFTSADEDPSAAIYSNAIARTSVTGAGVMPGEPLYSSVRIEIQTPGN